nr:MAG TPA: hypothetical protein [Bacteriophage sp.]
MAANYIHSIAIPIILYLSKLLKHIHSKQL